MYVFNIVSFNLNMLFSKEREKTIHFSFPLFIKGGENERKRK